MSSNPILPTEVVEKIVEHCDFPVVQALRKSSNSLRDLVGRVDPESSITSIHMRSNMESIQLNLKTGDPTSANAELLYPQGNKLNIEYKPYEQGCCVILEKEGGEKSVIILKGEDYKKTFWQDFEILLTYHGDALLDNFTVDFEQVDYNPYTHDHTSEAVRLAGHFYPFVGKLERFLETRRLKVKKFNMMVHDTNEYYESLSHLDAESIESIHASWIVRNDDQLQHRRSWKSFEWEAQWKRAKHVDVQGFGLTNFVYIMHFETIKGLWDVVENGPFNRMVQSIFTSANPAKHFSIKAVQISFLDDLRRTHGDSPDDKWYFRSPGNNIMVSFVLTQDVSPFAFEFKAIPLEKVEEVERIQDWARVVDVDE